MELNDKNIEIFKTKDGSLGLFNKKLNEIYHDRYGAKIEAYEKFVEPVLPFYINKPAKILDICYGIGYNTKTALKYLKNIIQIDCVEINSELVKYSAEFEFEPDINKIIENNLKNEDFIHFFIGDIRKIIKNISKTYDLIFYDGFSPVKQPSVWSEDLIYEIIKKNGQ